ncbi:hypothetical protein Btru_012783 [Bulinus truncatus]|nr:hypothetical protein Btru_012783 [Bulinus truncatus]
MPGPPCDKGDSLCYFICLFRCKHGKKRPKNYIVTPLYYYSTTTKLTRSFTRSSRDKFFTKPWSERDKMSSEPASNPLTHVPGLSKEELATRYTKWAQNGKYEQDLREEVYKGPAITADVLAELFPDVNSRSDVNVLDVAAGSGFVGEKLAEKGFKKIDALEPSEGLLNIARNKGIYSRFFQTYITDKPTEVEADSYDAVVISGGFGENHIPCSGLDELIRVAKPGGVVVIAMSEYFLSSVTDYKDRLEPRMKAHEEAGKWVSICRKVYPEYFHGFNGVVFAFRVL